MKFIGGTEIINDWGYILWNVRMVFLLVVIMEIKQGSGF
jgi:hypothetical protein